MQSLPCVYVSQSSLTASAGCIREVEATIKVVCLRMNNIQVLPRWVCLVGLLLAGPALTKPCVCLVSTIPYQFCRLKLSEVLKMMNELEFVELGVRCVWLFVPWDCGGCEA